jgi:hypothetical protein
MTTAQIFVYKTDTISYHGNSGEFCELTVTMTTAQIFVYKTDAISYYLL